MWNPLQLHCTYTFVHFDQCWHQENKTSPECLKDERILTIELHVFKVIDDVFCNTCTISKELQMLKIYQSQFYRDNSSTI